MTTIFTKSAAEFWGRPWDPGVAMLVDGKPVTFAELKARRVRAQKERLQRISETEPTRHAAHIWTFYVSHWIYHGWHLYVRTLHDRWWIRECNDFALSLMRQFPCGLFPIPDNFYRWKKAFAEQYSRGPSTGGMILGWLNLEYGRPSTFVSL